VVPGGATTFYRLSKLKNIHSVLKDALLSPIEALLDNAGLLEEDIGGILSTLNYGDDLVYDVLNHEVVGSWDAGIIDPALVISSAIGNAISVAATLVTLGGVVVVARDETLERQMELSDQAFNNMMQS
jgi:chaperonin GroEL (HSP60 family)